MIAALARIKSYLDYGIFQPIQIAAIAALNGPQDCVEEIRATVPAAPRRAVSTGLTRAGWEVDEAEGDDVRVGARSRAEFEAMGSLEFSKFLLQEAKVAVSPGIGFGEYGDELRALRADRERAPHPPGGARHSQRAFAKASTGAASRQVG